MRTNLPQGKGGQVRFFALITERMIRRGTFRSVEELESAIYAWLANWNNKPRPFVWKATADVILVKVRRCKELPRTPQLAATMPGSD